MEAAFAVVFGVLVGTVLLGVVVLILGFLVIGMLSPIGALATSVSEHRRPRAIGPRTVSVDFRRMAPHH